MAKKVVWLIQDVNMRFKKLNEVFSALENLGFEYKTFGVLPFTNTITGLEDILDEDVMYVVIAGTKVLSVLTDVEELSELNDFLTEKQLQNQDFYLDNLKNAIFYDINKFDQLSYNGIGLPLLNDSPELYLIGDNLDKTFDVDKFIKPSRDLKAFNGGIIKSGQTIEHFIKSQMHQSFYKEEVAIVGDLKNIQSEYRFFVVEEKIVTGSMYKLGDKVVSDKNIPIDMMEAAQNYSKLYQPSDVFTMDLAYTDKGIKIVEYNCWNCSGHYDCDLDKIYLAIDSYVKSIILK